MQRKSFESMQCPVARGLERAGDGWSMLILRDAFYGIRRFDDFVQSLGIAPNILSRRLRDLVQAGLLQRRPYCARPKRYEYVLTEQGRDFRPVLLALMAWGNRHFAPEGPSILLTDTTTGEPVELAQVDLRTGERITRGRHSIVAGPSADERTRINVDFRNAHLAADRH
ncbi:winged helix-turn-helix transcriptional regulator [Dyella jiangningensis]|uniref:Transcriptional regulator n=1 Tax=Dyella jiangningensis TaxID=1379159 RepID=A0A328P2X1_9GAMM|nr:helix-turn-helix domain-containing protein [Dyella jiangningensis]RAO74534.1 transcriptional regulator [Dyella jiangningensis]